MRHVHELPDQVMVVHDKAGWAVCSCANTWSYRAAAWPAHAHKALTSQTRGTAWWRKEASVVCGILNKRWPDGLLHKTETGGPRVFNGGLIGITAGSTRGAWERRR